MTPHRPFPLWSTAAPEIVGAEVERRQFARLIAARPFVDAGLITQARVDEIIAGEEAAEAAERAAKRQPQPEPKWSPRGCLATAVALAVLSWALVFAVAAFAVRRLVGG